MKKPKPLPEAASWILPLSIGYFIGRYEEGGKRAHYTKHPDGKNIDILKFSPDSPAPPKISTLPVQWHMQQYGFTPNRGEFKEASLFLVEELTKLNRTKILFDKEFSTKQGFTTGGHFILLALELGWNASGRYIQYRLK